MTGGVSELRHFVIKVGDLVALEGGQTAAVLIITTGTTICLPILSHWQRTSRGVSEQQAWAYIIGVLAISDDLIESGKDDRTSSSYPEGLSL